MVFPKFPLTLPPTDPAKVFEMFRGNFATEILTIAVHELKIFEQIGTNTINSEELRKRLGLARRPWVVITTILKAFGFLEELEGNLSLPELAKNHLLEKSPFSVSSYIGLAAQSPAVQSMLEKIKSNKAAESDHGDKGAAFIFHEGIESAMEKEASARFLTLSLSGRAMNVAPVLAEKYPIFDSKVLLDVGAGSGLYSIAYLEKHPQLKAILWDSEQVLKVAREFLVTSKTLQRANCIAGDMFRDPVPHGVDTILLSNILHDWDVNECKILVKRLASALPVGGKILVHDVLLNDELDGPKEIALYSAALFYLTEGRAYSLAEYKEWLNAEGMTLTKVIPTLAHCSVLVFEKALG
ncbi:MAG: hypothetical protein RL595_1662 [Planctomycetota bacterium]